MIKISEHSFLKAIIVFKYFLNRGFNVSVSLINDKYEMEVKDTYAEKSVDTF